MPSDTPAEPQSPIRLLHLTLAKDQTANPAFKQVTTHKMDSPYSRELEIAFSVLRAAASLSQSIISSNDKGVIDKNHPEDGFDAVTIADFAIQALLAATFHLHFPQDILVGEESADKLRGDPKLLGRIWELLVGVGKEHSPLFRIPGTEEDACDLIDMCGEGNPGPGRVWVFDPIDGTKGFVKGELYAINIALLVDGKQVLSAVACPNLSPDVSGTIGDKDVDQSGRGSIFFAVRGYGAFIMPLDGEDRPRRLNPHPPAPRKEDLRFVSCSTIPTSGSNEFHQAVASSLGMSFPGCDLVPWVVRWASLAIGLGNTTVWVYNRLGRRGKTWDHAGAMLLFEETGGKVTDVFGRDIDVAAGRTLGANFGFVASLVDLHQTVLNATQKTLMEFGREDVLREGGLLG